MKRSQNKHKYEINEVLLKRLYNWTQIVLNI